MELTQSQLKQIWKHVSEGEGGYCPVCEKWGKVNSVHLTGSMVRALGWLYKESQITGEQWINIPNAAPSTVMRSYNITSLKYWGFVEPRPKPAKVVQLPHVRGQKREPQVNTRTSGYWAITDMGKLFLTNQSRVPDRVFVYADAVQGYGADTVSAKEVMDKKFDYDAMMNDIYAIHRVSNATHYAGL
jgi:hypothetical protein